MSKDTPTSLSVLETQTPRTEVMGLTRRRLAQIAAAVVATLAGATSANAQTTSTPTPARAEASTWVPNPKYEEIIQQMKEGESFSQFARRMVKEGRITMEQYGDLIAYNTKKDELALAKKDQEGRKLDQVVIAKREEGRALDQVSARNQQIIDSGNLKVIATLESRRKNIPLTEREKGFIIEMYYDRTTSAQIKKILEEKFPEIISSLKLSMR